MAKITVAKTAGFCFGVDRAVNLVYDLINKGEKAATLGPIIHNPQMVEELEKKGVVISNSVEDVEGGYTVVIRSHGVGKDVYELLEDKGLSYCDATCPFVSKIHKIVSENTSKDIPLFIAGDEKHAEVIGIMGHSSGDVYCFDSLENLQKQLDKSNILPNSAFCVVSQTTFNQKKWEKCEFFLKKHYTNAKIFGTICSATSLRQKEAESLSEACDLMVVVGGKHSSNTAKLADICSKNCTTLLIETADELISAKEKLTSADLIGLTAGASTPAVIIKEVLTTMSETIKNEGIAVDTTAETLASANTQEKINTEAKKTTTVDETAAYTEPVELTDDMSFEELLDASFSNMNFNQKVKGVVVGITPTEVRVDIGRKQTGIIPANELSEDSSKSTSDLVKVDDELDLIIMKTNDQEGIITLSKKRFDSQKGFSKIQEAFDAQTTVPATINAVVKGGVSATAFGVRVFIPASHATLSRSESLDNLVGTDVEIKIIDIRRGRSVVGSLKESLKEARKAQLEQIWSNIAVGNKYTGTVKSLTSYGAFVDIGGVDGMVHITELSWLRIKHPSEVVNVGDTVEVYVKDIDTEKRRISLGYKKTEDNPWEILKAKYNVGDTVKVKIVSLTSYGAFANVISGIDGLIHISQIANKHIEKTEDVLSIGEEVEVQITDIDYDAKRVSLSMRALLPEEEKVESEEAVEREPLMVSTDDAESIANAVEVIASEESEEDAE